MPASVLTLVSYTTFTSLTLRSEPMTVLLRPRNFFTQNPCLDVPPSYSTTPSQVAAGKTGIRGIVDSLSRLAFGGAENVKGGSSSCGECK